MAKVGSSPSAFPAGRIAPAVLEALKRVVGPQGWSDDPLVLERHTTDWLGHHRGDAPLLLRPGSTQEVSAIVSICAREGVGVVPQGGNTSLVGGSVPVGTGREVVVNLSRMNRILEVDAANDSIAVEAGCVLAAIQAAARDAGRLFALRLGAEGSCQIGGNIASNAGGTNVLRYGSMRDQVLGLEVVLPDGRVWDGMRCLRKNNTGYDLKQIFVGSEGTLGIVTRAVLKLAPLPAAIEVAVCAVPTIDAALELLALCQARTGGAVAAFELMGREGLELALKHFPDLRFPLGELHDWQVLVEVASTGDAAILRDGFEGALGEALARGLAGDAALAASIAQGRDVWRLREALAEADDREGVSHHGDVAVPLSRIGRFVHEASEALRLACPGVRTVAFGHMGDGNIHFGIVQPEGSDGEAFRRRGAELTAILHDAAHRHGGSISAEHGLGQSKRDAIRRYRGEVEHDLMLAVKRALDPRGILNPGKLLAGDPPDAADGVP